MIAAARIPNHSTALLLFGLASLACAIASPSRAAAGVCSVPGDHPTIGNAVSAECSEISIQAGTFSEAVTIERSLKLYGEGAGSTVVLGRLRVRGTGVRVEIDDLTVDIGGCYQAGIEVSDGAETQTATGSVEVVDSGSCLLFRNGFEATDARRGSPGLTATVGPRRINNPGDPTE